MNETNCGNERILVVDDEEPMRELVHDILETSGYDVIQVEDGASAVAEYMKRKDDISLVILDMMLPGMSGEEVYRELKKINPGVLVLFSSGYGEDGQTNMSLDDGMAEFIGKPYQMDTLLDKVKTILATGAGA